MVTIKSYTDIEQSKKLSEIISPTTADAFYRHVSWNNNTYVIIQRENIIFPDVYDIPCWSLAALVNILPRSIEFKDDKYYLRFMKEYIEYANDEISITGRCLHTTGNNNLVDACCEMIQKLNKLKLL